MRLNIVFKYPLLALLIAEFSMLTSYAEAAHTPHVDSSVTASNIRFDPALTQSEFSTFAREFSWIFSPRVQYDLSPEYNNSWNAGVRLATTSIDQHSAPWNNTFVHPDATSMLGDKFAVPWLSLHRQIGDTQAVGAYYFNNMQSNYAGLGLDYLQAIYQDPESDGITYIRVNGHVAFGTEDLTAQTLAVEGVYKQTVKGFKPYAGIGVLFSRMTERSLLVNLKNEINFNLYALLGAKKDINQFEIAAQAEVGVLTTLSIRTSYQF